MPEVYTCICGGQKWIIYGDGVICCVDCEREIQIGDGQLPAAQFNATRQFRVQNEKTEDAFHGVGVQVNDSCYK